MMNKTKQQQNKTELNCNLSVSISHGVSTLKRHTRSISWQEISSSLLGSQSTEMPCCQKNKMILIVFLFSHDSVHSLLNYHSSLQFKGTPLTSDSNKTDLFWHTYTVHVFMKN